MLLCAAAEYNVPSTRQIQTGQTMDLRRLPGTFEGPIALEADRTEDAWARRNTGRNWNIVDAVGEIAEARGASYSQIALAWLRAQPSVSSIVGVRTMAQLEDNLGAAEIDLTAEELANWVLPAPCRSSIPIALAQR